MQMRVFTSLEQIKETDHTAIALGNFDGVHKGHQEVIGLAIKKAREKGLKSAVFTFSNHPRNMLAGKQVVENIVDPKEKIRLIDALSVDYFFCLPFDLQIQNTSPRDFLQGLLIDKLRMKEACCGFNYRFGKDGAGSPGTLRELSWELGFGLEMLDPYLIDGVLVSSSLIRQLIKEGNMEQCARYLGRRYALEGKVIQGNRLGRTISFPTSNVVIDPEMTAPADGVYVSRCRVGGLWHNSVTNVGNRPTIGDGVRAMETYIFDFESDIYGREIRVEFLKKIRDEIKFESVEALSKQIKKDCLTAREYHAII